MQKLASSSPFQITLAVVTAFALTSFSPGQQFDPASTPSGSKAPLNLVLGEARSLKVNQAYGVLTDSVPIVVPPGRHGVEPHLQLTYSSSKGNGLLGMGWGLDIGYVSLDSRYGLPQAFSSDTFNFSIAGIGGELHNDGSGNYHSTTELVYRVFHKTAGGSWTMEDGQGNLYTFGSTSASSIAGTLWLLDSVEDPLGNRISYTYLNDEGAFYPQTITYTGFGSSPGANQLTFSYQQRPDVQTTWAHGVSEIHRLRLARIEADVLVPSFQIARAYGMTYSLTAIGESVLTEVQLIGDDNTSAIALRKMGYSNHAEGWNSIQGPANFDQSVAFTVYSGDDAGTRLLDIDGDGCADLVDLGNVIWLGDCNGNFFQRQPESEPWTNALHTLPVSTTISTYTDSNGNPQTQSNGIQFMDINGDGRADVIIADQATGTQAVYLNTYNSATNAPVGWAQATSWTMPTIETSYDAQDGLANCTGAVPKSTNTNFWLYYQGNDINGNQVNGTPGGVTFVDVNGDGLPDIVWSMYQNTGAGNVCIAVVYLNTGSGWVKSAALSHQLALLVRQHNAFSISNAWPTGWNFIDINGDGMADAVYLGTGTHAAYLATGNGWTEDTNYTVSLQKLGINSVGSQGSPTGLLTYDFSHDGLVDLIYATQGQTPKAFRNTGSGFEEDVVMEGQMSVDANFQGTIGTNNYAQTAVMADINGDGIIDLIPINSSGLASFAYLGGWCSLDECSTLNSSGQPNGLMLSDGMLTSWEGPLGEQATVGYTRAPNDFAIPMYVVSKLSRSEARADQSTRQVENYSYTYEGGLYQNREFLGFAATSENQPNGNIKATAWDQRPLFVGQEDSEYVTDSSGYEHYFKINSWTANTPTQGYLSAKNETFQDGSMADGFPFAYSAVTTMSYDAHLNLVQFYHNPNTSVTGEDSTTVYSWVIDDATGFWSMPASTTTYSGSGTSAQNMVNNTNYFYDGLSQGQISTGKLTMQQDIVSSGSNAQSVTRSTSYDQYGNVLSVTDRNGNVTSFTYDTQTATQRLVATDPASNSIHSTMDPRFDAVLTDIDASGNLTSYQYDAFGRLAKVIRPGDSGLAGGTVSYTYTLPSPSFPTGLSVTQRESTSNGNAMVMTTLYDGYGQVYETIRTNNGQRVVTTASYDNMGFPYKFSKPYLDGQTPLYSTLTFDPMHRIVEIVDADGGTTTRSYQLLQTTETDRRGLVTTTTFNPQGQVLSKALPTPTGTATTQYVYDVLGQMTQVIRADGSTSRIAYDMLGRKTGITDPNTGNFTYQYDNQDHLTAVTGPDGGTIQYNYDKVGNLLSRVYPGGITHTISYGTAGNVNAVGRMVSVVDSAGTLTFNYDARGRVLARTRYVNANQKTYLTGYLYDSSDHVVSEIYPDGFKVIFAYDGLGRVSGVTDGTGRAIATKLSYSPSSRLTSLAFGNGVSSSYSYDAIDRLSTIKTGTLGGSSVQNLAYTYDSDSNITNIQDAVNTDTQSFIYDSMNRLTSATGAGYGTETYSYDALGNLLTKGSATFIMDSASPERADCMIPTTPGVTTCAGGGGSTYSIGYDARGNVNSAGTSSGPTQYSYDAENRLTTETTGGSVVETNVYDFWGDRVVQQTSAETRVFIDGIYEEGASTASRHVYAGNLLLATIVTQLGQQAKAPKIARHSISVPLHFLVAAPPAANQRLFLAGSLGISLIVMLLGGCVRVSHSGRRLRIRLCAPKITKPFGSLVSLLMILSMLLSGTLDASALASPDPPPTPAAGAMRTLTMITRITSNLTPETRYYYHVNHLGSVNVVTNDSGNVVTERQYKPYGEMYTNTGTVSTSTLPFTFDGKRLDGAGALTYFGARFYNPVLARFMSADTEIRRPTNPMELNRYCFAIGNPIRYTDPTGHFPWKYFLAGLAIGGILILAAVSGGAGLALLAVAASCIGFGAGALIATGLGYSPTSSDFWQIALTGALIGAAVGAGAGAIIDGALEASAADGGLDLGADGSSWVQTARSVATDMVKSMAFGSPQSVVVHELQGGGTDGLLLGCVEGTGESAVTGAITGRLTSAAGALIPKGAGPGLSALTKFGLKLGVTLVIQGGLWTYVGLEHQTLPHYLVFQQIVPGLSSAFESSNQKNPAVVAQPGYDPEAPPPPPKDPRSANQGDQPW